MYKCVLEIVIHVMSFLTFKPAHTLTLRPVYVYKYSLLKVLKSSYSFGGSYGMWKQS